MAKIQTSKVCWLPNFFYNPLCTLGIGLMAHKPVAAPLGTPVSRAVYTRVPVCDHPTAPLHVCEYMRHWSTRHFWRSFSVQPPPFLGKKRTQFSKFEVVESKYRRFNRARWQLTAKKCDQKFPFGSNSTSRCRRETKDIAPWSSALRLSCAMFGLIAKRPGAWAGPGVAPPARRARGPLRAGAATASSYQAQDQCMRTWLYSCYYNRVLGCHT